MAVKYDVPERTLAWAKKAAHVPETDPDAIGSYELPPEIVRDIAGSIGVHLPSSGLHWFLEPFAEQVPA
jgi:hypothetical protein